MRLEQTTDTDGTTRTLSVNGTEYDLTDRPFVFAALSVAFFALLGSVVLVALSLAGWFVSWVFSMGMLTMFYGVEPLFAFAGLGLLAFSVAIVLLLLAGGVKYLLTGSAEPFITINIDTETTDDEI